MASINQLLNESGLPALAQRQLRQIFEAVLADTQAVNANVVALAAKLDDDAGVTDTDYEAGLDPVKGLTQ